jgi:hypothetical protein
LVVAWVTDRVARIEGGSSGRSDERPPELSFEG